MIGLIIGLLILIGWGVHEFWDHRRNRKKIPEVIHINGTRGKSSVTRLIAAGLRAGNFRVMAKTTGSAPRLIYTSGREKPIIRFFGSNIREQLKVIKFAAKKNLDFLVLECMAVTPEYQWETQHRMVQSTVGVITNSRLDHLDVMGPGLRNVTLSMCNTIPHKGIVFTSEERVFPLMKKVADKMHSEFHYVDNSHITDEDMRGFRWIEHRDNVALALAVCDHFGVGKKAALKGMYDSIPDIGATEIFLNKVDGKELYFAHSFAANDPDSTIVLIKYIRKIFSNIPSVAIVLNTRADRMYRSKQLIEMLEKEEWDGLFLIGEQEFAIFNYGISHGLPAQKIYPLGRSSGDELVKAICNLEAEKLLVFGIGNIGGNGGPIVDYFKARRC
jgi:poly-gamma-glutamate synthase PgsB/CapB